jgi:hypothetical protein
MNLTQKAGRRNLQPIYDSIVEAYNRGSLDEMKRMAYEFVVELRTDKVKAYKFNESINNIKMKDKLLMFVTNLHMQDSKETASR